MFFTVGGNNEKLFARKIEVYGINLNVRDNEEMK